MANSFPFIRPAPEVDPVGIPEALDLSGQRCLVIDPMADMRTVMSSALQAFGASKIDHAAKATLALGQIRQHQYDLILSEYDLGHGQDGLFVFEEAKRHGLFKASCVFIVVTGERRAQKVMSAAELTPDAIVLKPFTTDALLARLARALYRKQRLRPIDEAILARDFLRAIRLCDSGIEAGGEDEAVFLRMKVHLLLRVADWAGTRDLCRTLLTQNDWAWARMALGKALFQLQQHDEAKVLFQGVIAEHELVMEAYDWLARTQSAAGEHQDALATISRAAQRSPFVISRQRELGELAWRNEELALAEQAWSETVRLSRYSFWRDAGDLGRLTEVQVTRGDYGTARRTIAEIRKEFPQVANTIMADALDANIYLAQGDRAKARQLLDQSLAASEALAAPLPAEVGLILSGACVLQQRNDKGEEIAQAMLRNRHDDLELNARLLELFKRAGREDVAERLIASTAESIVQLNNEAVRLAQQGDLAAAAEQFVRAVTEMPANVLILLNAVNAMLAYVNQAGWHATYMEHVAEYLRRVQALEPENGRVLQLAEITRRTRRRFGVNA